MIVLCIELHDDETIGFCEVILYSSSSICVQSISGRKCLL